MPPTGPFGIMPRTTEVLRSHAAVTLAVLWVALLVAYAVAFWPTVSWDVAVSVEPPLPMWLADVIIPSLVALPPIVLGIATGLWFRFLRPRPLDLEA